MTNWQFISIKALDVDDILLASIKHYDHVLLVNSCYNTSITGDYIQPVKLL